MTFDLERHNPERLSGIGVRLHRRLDDGATKYRTVESVERFPILRRARIAGGAGAGERRFSPHQAQEAVRCRPCQAESSWSSARRRSGQVEIDDPRGLGLEWEWIHGGE